MKTEKFEDLEVWKKIVYCLLSTVYLIFPVYLSSTAYAADMSPSPSPSLKIPDVVAAVNNVNITREDLERRMAQSRSMNPERFDAMSLDQRKKAATRTIDNMILREVIYQEAVKRHIVVTDKELNLSLENLKSQFPSEEAFYKTLADANITIPAWKEETGRNLMAEKLESLMMDDIEIRDSEIRDYYEKNKRDLNKDSKETLEDHKEHVMFILRQARWQQIKSAWYSGLLANTKVWKWSPDEK